MLHDTRASLWIVGVGSGGEVPIDYTDPYSKMRRTGIFDSRFDADSLRRLALSGGGSYIAAPVADALSTAFSRLDNDEMTVRKSRVVSRRRPFSLPFLITAIGLLASTRFIRRFSLGALL
jgi:Ca-activated chloride channel family protein